jgi:cytochrome P450
LEILLLLVVGLVGAWFWLHWWYFRLVARWRAQIHHQDGSLVPGQAPRLVMGNLVDVYRSKNRLSAYDSFHQKFGEIVQIFWLWRQQISITSYPMAYQILVSRQKKYQKYPPNWLLQRLYGSSVLTDSGDDWKQQRLLIKQVFSKATIAGFHNIFVSYTEQLAAKWAGYMGDSGQSARLDIYPDLTALFLDIVGQAALGHHFGALNGETDEFLASLTYVLSQSTQPAHQFVPCWKHLPSPANRRLSRALETIDYFFCALMQQHQAPNRQPRPDSANVLDLLLQAMDAPASGAQPLTGKDVRDNLLAIIVNGYETVATTVSLALYLLARHPDKLTRVQTEVDQVMRRAQGRLRQADLPALQYLDAVVHESLRLYPAMAGLQRVSVAGDVLAGWSIPAQQVVGINLKPLHLNPHYFGQAPQQFRPERYLNPDPPEAQIQGRCPLHAQQAAGEGRQKQTAGGVCLPLTFGAGPRKCLGEAFAMYEMKVALAVLLHRFDFQVAPNFEIDPELGKFGLFVTMLPRGGVQMVIRPRPH